MMTNNEFSNFLRDGKWYDIEKYVSKQELTEEQQLMIVKQQDEVMLHEALARNPKLCHKAQLIIARRRDDSYAEARLNLAGNCCCYAGAQTWLAKDPDESVRHALAFNSRLCKKVAMFLLNDTSFEVLDALYENVPSEDWRNEIREALRNNKKFWRYHEAEEAAFAAEFAAKG